MAKMILGSYTLLENPSSVSDLMTPRRRATSVDTFTGTAFFSWGVSVAGKTIDLNWVACTVTQYDSLRGLLEADAALVFNPQDGSGFTYNVEIMGLRGEYWIKLGSGHRQNVVLTLKILSKVA